jgi:hypothetical protein
MSRGKKILISVGIILILFFATDNILYPIKLIDARMQFSGSWNQTGEKFVYLIEKNKYSQGWIPLLQCFDECNTKLKSSTLKIYLYDFNTNENELIHEESSPDSKKLILSPQIVGWLSDDEILFSKNISISGRLNKEYYKVSVNTRETEPFTNPDQNFPLGKIFPYKLAELINDKASKFNYPGGLPFNFPPPHEGNIICPERGKFNFSSYLVDEQLNIIGDIGADFCLQHKAFTQEPAGNGVGDIPAPISISQGRRFVIHNNLNWNEGSQLILVDAEPAYEAQGYFFNLPLNFVEEVFGKKYVNDIKKLSNVSDIKSGFIKKTGVIAKIENSSSLFIYKDKTNPEKKPELIDF